MAAERASCGHMHEMHAAPDPQASLELPRADNFRCGHFTADRDSVPTSYRSRSRRVRRCRRPGQHVGLIPDRPGLDGDSGRRDCRGEERWRRREQRRRSNAGRTQQQQLEAEDRGPARPGALSA